MNVFVSSKKSCKFIYLPICLVFEIQKTVALPGTFVCNLQYEKPVLPILYDMPSITLN